MSEKESRIKKIEKQIGVEPESEGVVEYGEYVRAVKSILAEMEKGKTLEAILKHSAYGKILKEELRKNIPRLLKKLREEMEE